MTQYQHNRCGNHNIPNIDTVATLRHQMGVIVLLLGTLLSTAPSLTEAHHLLGEYELDCDSTFPCPPKLQRRIDLWVEVFSKYRKGQVILHDSKRPERIYTVMDVGLNCSRRREPHKIKKKRKQIATQLRQVATKLEKKHSLNKFESHLAQMFKGEKPSELRRAARQIRCQDGNRDRFAEALQRYGNYKKMVIAGLRDANLPTDIQYLPFVESGYNPMAYSRVGAAGMWQIMPRTARKLGLQLGSTIDERLDPQMATNAAMQYFKRSYKILDKAARKKKISSNTSLFPFVITSYNYGITGMRRAIIKMGPDFVKVIHEYRARTFRVAVKNFYASFLAARHVARNASKYFPDTRLNSPIHFQEILIGKSTSAKRLSNLFDINKKQLRQLNPSLTRNVWAGRRHVPKGFMLRLPFRNQGYDSELKKLAQLPSEKPRMAESDYRVRHGDTACRVASTHRVRCRDLIAINGLGRRATIYVGQILKIPGSVKKLKATAKTKAKPVKLASATSLELKIVAKTPIKSPKKDIQVPLAHAPGELSPAELAKAFGIGEDLYVEVLPRAGSKIYRIRIEPEETLGHYADWLGIGSTRPLRELNDVSAAKNMRIGARLKLPIKNEKQIKRFERRRISFHRSLETQFQEHYRITGKEEYQVKRGDNGWVISKRAEVPLWLLRRFNPEILFRPPQVGEIVYLPVMESRKPS
ncbi:MAG: transglycosylase SLT domain-containing protein [Gammaproteobacteria bacterium]|nr:transglycosylase SLT domain-containing protein [Gammaproteobacteria bacterium]